MAVKMTGQKALFFDIDGTLYCRENPAGVPESAKEALRKLKENGHLIFICTGRVDCAVEQALRSLPFDGMILGCGTQIVIHGRQLFYYALPVPAVERALKLAKQYGAYTILEGRESLYGDAQPPESEFYSYYTFRKELFGSALRPVTGSLWEVSKMTVRFSQKWPENRDRLKARVSEFLDVIDSGGSAEFVPKGFSKASGIAYILEKLGINRADTFAFGDSMNDYQMLSYVGHGIAMGNSSEEILRLCAVHTDSVYEDGIYNACLRYGLIS